MPFTKCHKPNNNGIVRESVTIDKAGRVVLPKILRDQLHLSPGDTLDISVEDEQVTLRPRRTEPPLQKERGVWVLRTGEPLTAQETLAELNAIRGQRARRNAGDPR